MDMSSLLTIKYPESLTQARTLKNLEDESNKLHVLKLVGNQFSEYLSSNLIGSLLHMGTIQQPDDFNNINVPCFLCNYCDFKTVTKLDMIEHMQIHRFGCKFCEFEVFSRSEIVKHTLKCHTNSINGSLLWFCVLHNDKYHLEQRIRGLKRSAEITEDSKVLQPKTMKLVENNTITRQVVNYLVEKESNIGVDQPNKDLNTNLFIQPSNIKLEPVDNIDFQKCKAEVNPTTNTSISMTTEERENELIHPSKIKHELSHNMEYENPGFEGEEEDNGERLELFKNTLARISKELNTGSQQATVSCPPVITLSMRNATELVIPTIQNNTSIQQQESQSYLRSILTTNGSLSRLVNQSSSKDIVQNTAAKPHSLSLLSQASTISSQDSPPNVKIEIDDDSFSNHSGYIPKVLDVSVGPVAMPSLDLSSSESQRSNSNNSPSIRYNENAQNSSSSEAAHLPILRTMLTARENISSSRSNSENDLKIHEAEDSGSSNESGTENCDQEDADYSPNSSDEEEYARTCKETSKKRNLIDFFACINCDAVSGRGHYFFAKNHLLHNHKNTNLVLKDTSNNIFVYICPAKNCTFRNTDFNAFIHHLGLCGIFEYKTMCGSFGKIVQTTVLNTLKSILERSQSGWVYACCFCAMKFSSLDEVQQHKLQLHSKCYDYNSVFKFCEISKKVIIMCCQCSSEIEVVKWPDIFFDECAEHKLHCLVQSRKKLSVLNSSHLPKTDSTPQLRAILQHNPTRSTSQSPSVEPSGEDLPASRMLQWLISEGSRMMHMLK